MTRPSSIHALLAVAVLVGAALPGPSPGAAPGPELRHALTPVEAASGSAVGNFSAALNRLVELVAAGAGAILALVWARVALSWFSNDVTKKIQAKDRARDAFVGTMILGAALTGLVWGLAQWVFTGR